MGFGIRPWLHSRLCSAAIVSATLVALAAGGGLAASAQAATYTVGTQSDLTGTCAKPASGSCSLRQLIAYENALATTPNPHDSLVVPAGTYGLTNGELAITQSLAIVGAGARTTHVEVPAGVPAARVFDIQVPNSGSKPAVTISGLEISGGTANESNGFFGGNVLNAGSLVLNEDWITAGTASSGGGISNNGGTLLVEHSLVSGNHASTGGGDSGAIQNHGTAVCGAACSPGKKAVLTVEDSTVAENDARLGAGIFSWSDAADGNEVSIVRSTIADNLTEEERGGSARGPGAGLLISDGTAKVAGSIVAFNDESTEGNFIATNCSPSRPPTIASLGYNLENGTDCGFTATGDLQETSPGFSAGTLQNNGGNTDTLALEPTSAATDAIPTSYSRCKGSDQRGTTRPQGAGCDIGAFELVPLTIRATEGAKFSTQVAISPNCGIFDPPTPTIAWGDGQTSAGTVTETGISGSHTYAEEGTFNGTVTYTNDCGSHKVAFQAKVADAALSGAGVAVSAVAGASFSGKVATFSDADPGGVASDYTATISWGDGTSSTAGTVSAATGGGFEVKGSHTYAAAGQHTTSVTISDVGGAKTTATGSANVVGQPLVSNVSVLSVTETTAKIGFKIDPDGADTTYVIEYGPNTSYGQKTAPVDIGATRGPQSLTRTLTGLVPNRTYHFDVVATNSAAPKGVGGGDRSFTTEPDAPLSATGESVSGMAGVKLSATVATFTDADPNGVVSDYTASIDWGDGSSTAGTVSAAAGGGFEVKGSHTYAAGGQYPTSVTISDVGGAKATATGSADVVGPPVVSNVHVITVTETAVTIGFTIDPAGADTTYAIEYGSDTSYGQQTTPVDIGATGGPQSLTRTLTGLEPNKTYHFDVLATNSAVPGGVGVGDQPFTTGQPSSPIVPPAPSANNPLVSAAPGSGVLDFKETLAALPPPVLGKSANVEPVSGTVYIELPPGAKLSSSSLSVRASAAVTKGRAFIPLTEARQIPFGSILDTSAGVARITTATTTSAKGKLQSGDFGAGVFKLLQRRRQRGLTELNIIDTHSARQVCATLGKARIAATHPSSKVLGRLTASSHGHFTARGHYSAATVRGTTWSVANQCNGTLTRVKRGVISVRDFHRRKTITLFTGQAYLARAPFKRG